MKTIILRAAARVGNAERRAEQNLRPYAPLVKVAAMLAASIIIPLAAVRPVQAEYRDWGLPSGLAGALAVLGAIEWLCIGLIATAGYVRRLHHQWIHERRRSR